MLRVAEMTLVYIQLFSLLVDVFKWGKCRDIGNSTTVSLCKTYWNLPFINLCHIYFLTKKFQVWRLISGNKHTIKYHVNAFTIFLLTNIIFAKQFRNNTKPFKQTGTWLSVKKSSHLKKKNPSIQLPCRQRVFSRSGRKFGKGAKVLLISPLTSGEDCVRQQAPSGPLAHGNGPCASYLISSQCLALQPLVCERWRKEGVHVTERAQVSYELSRF